MKHNRKSIEAALDAAFSSVTRRRDAEAAIQRAKAEIEALESETRAAASRNW